MTLRKIIQPPLHVLWQDSLTLDKLGGVNAGIKQILELAGISQELPVHYLWQRRQLDWLIQRGPVNARDYKEYQSLDWHIYRAGTFAQIPGHLNSLMLMNTLGQDPTHATKPRYELVVVNQPLHWNALSLRIMAGVANRHQRTAIIDVSPFLYLLYPPPNGEVESDEIKKEKAFAFHLVTWMLTMHELGHVFGLGTETNSLDPTDNDFKIAHCQNECVMYWMGSLDLYKKIIKQPFCEECKKGLKQHFVIP